VSKAGGLLKEFAGKKPMPDYFESVVSSEIPVFFAAYAHKRGLLLPGKRTEIKW
jgi:hypothetical protein